MDTSEKDLKGILKYARAHCEDRCPADRDPNICLGLIEICKEAGEPMPNCFEETEGFSRAFFSAKVKDLEKRRGKKVQDLLAELKNNGVRTLEDQIDKMDAEFALSAIKAINDRAKSAKA